MLLDNSLHPGRSSVTRLPTGGIRQDSQGIQDARRLASVLTEKEIKNQRQIHLDIWDRTVLKSLNERIRSAGGRLVLFNMPMSSIQEKISFTDIGQKNKKTVADLLRSANLPLLQPAFAVTDDDFPDLWHLRGARSAEFTRSIAQAYLQLK